VASTDVNVLLDEYDNAALAMMERAADAWEHNQFKEVVVKVANIEIYYKVRLDASDRGIWNPLLTPLNPTGSQLLPAAAAHTYH
jgi:peptidyl-tRNA hydrolase